MLAFALALGLYLYWGVIGYPVLAVMGERREALRNALWAPVLGFVIVLIPVFTLNRFGIPVGRFAPWLGIALLIGAGVLWWKGHPATIPWRAYWPFAGAILLAAVMTGWPIFRFGFAWMSYCNDDMANYCLGASRFLNYGYASPPDTAMLIHGQDYSLYYWFLHIPNHVRAGSELIIAWTAGTTGLSPPDVYMPLMLAFLMCLVGMTSAFILTDERYRPHALTTAVLLAVSALTSFGVVYQLIAQVSGIALLMAIALVLLRPTRDQTTRQLLTRGLLLGLLVAGLFIHYPEVFPFLALAAVAYFGLAMWDKTVSIKGLALLAAPSIAICLVVLNTYVADSIQFLAYQASTGTAKGDARTNVFPFYRVPSGMSVLWGLQTVAVPVPEPDQSIRILIGAVLLIVAVGSAVWMAWRKRQPIAIFASIMFAMSMFLFIQSSGFGLYKMAMFIQPFMLGSLVLAWFSIAKKPVWRIAPLVVVAALGMRAQSYYVRASRGYGSALSEIPDASRSQLNEQFRAQLAHAGVGPEDGLLSDTYNLVVAKFQVLYTRGKDVALPGSRLIGAYTGVGATAKGTLSQRISIDLSERMRDRYKKLEFDLLRAGDPKTNGFTLNLAGYPDLEGNLPEDSIITTARQSVFNRMHYRDQAARDVLVVPTNSVKNHLIFAESALGRNYYLNFENISIYRLEPDPNFFTNDTMAGVGRYLLFQVVNPTPGPRMVVNMSCTYMADGENSLPPANVIGQERLPAGFVGRGSGRVISPPIAPQILAHLPFVALDFGTEGKHFPELRGGLMALFGKDVHLDPRQLVGFARDVSLISQAEYDGLDRPVRIEKFPDDLGNPALEYSGIYEDGWISEDAFFVLKQSTGRDTIAIRGVVPGHVDVLFRTELTVQVDGVEVGRQEMGIGQFELKFPVPATDRGRRVTLHFSKWQHLGPQDPRPAAAQIQSIGFEPASGDAGKN